jgi:hypothetical protein
MRSSGTTPPLPAGHLARDADSLPAADGSKCARWAPGVLLAAATFVLYARVAGHQFLHYDDDQYVTDDPWVRGGFS